LHLHKKKAKFWKNKNLTTSINSLDIRITIFSKTTFILLSTKTVIVHAPYRGDIGPGAQSRLNYCIYSLTQRKG